MIFLKNLYMCDTHGFSFPNLIYLMFLNGQFLMNVNAEKNDSFRDFIKNSEMKTTVKSLFITSPGCYEKEKNQYCN